MELVFNVYIEDYVCVLLLKQCRLRPLLWALQEEDFPICIKYATWKYWTYHSTSLGFLGIPYASIVIQERLFV